MEYIELVKASVCRLSPSIFDEYKGMLIGEHLSFSIIDHEAVTAEILAEKICDYFHALEIKTGKSFDKRLDAYMSDLDSIVGPRVAKAPQAKKGDMVLAAVPRARRYYEKALQIKNSKKPALSQLIDYSRIMMCLYTEVIKSDYEPITNFDFSADCLEPREVIRSVKEETIAGILPNTRKKRFDMTDLYDTDACSVIIMILFLWILMIGKVQGDTDHE